MKMVLCLSLLICLVGCSINYSKNISVFEEPKKFNIGISEFTLLDENQNNKIFEGFVTNKSDSIINHIIINFNIYDSKGFRINGLSYLPYARTVSLMPNEVWKVHVDVYERLSFGIKVKNIDTW